MANLLNFKLTLEDLLGPKVAAAIQKVQQLNQQVEKPHRLNVDTSQASGALSGLIGLVGGLGLAAAFTAGATSIITMGAKMEQTRIQFETFTGSAEKGNAVIADLQKFANLTPFDDEQVISSGRKLLAFGEDATSLNPILTKLGNISSATGKDLGELVSLYGKNKLSGIIQGEDLNQLNDSGIPVMKSLAAQLGVNVGQVRKMGEQGKISFAMLDKSFDELGGPAGKWGDLMDKQSVTIAGRWSSLVGAAQQTGASLGEMLNPLVGKVLDFALPALSLLGVVMKAAPAFIDENRTSLMALGVAMVAFNAETIILAGLQGVQKLITIAATVAQYDLNAALTANPIGLVIAGVALLTAGLVYLYKNSETVRVGLDTFAAGVKSTFLNIYQAAKDIMGGVGHLLLGIFRFDKDEIKKGLAAMADGAGGLVKKVKADAAQAAINSKFQFGYEQSAKANGQTPNAATAFANNKAGSAKTPGLTASLTKPVVGSSAGGGSKVTNITLRIDTLMRDVRLSGATMDESAKDLAQLIRDTVLAQLNDVNTLSSAN